MKDNYITAVLEMLEAGNEPVQVFNGLKRTLKDRGHSRLYASVLRGVEKVLSANSAEDVVVTVANQASYQKQQHAIQAALTALGSQSEPVFVTDQTIIGGFMVEVNKNRLDKSYKTKLVSLYRNLTK